MNDQNYSSVLSPRMENIMIMIIMMMEKVI